MESALQQKLRPRIDQILQTADLNTTTAKSVRKQLETEFQMDLGQVRKSVDGLIVECVQQLLDARSNKPTTTATITTTTTATTTTATTATAIDDNDRIKIVPMDPHGEQPQVPNKTARPSKRRYISAEIIRDDSDDDCNMDDMSSVDNETVSDHEYAIQLQRQESGLRTRSRGTRSSTSTTPKRPRTAGSAGKRNTGFHKPAILSTALQAIVGHAELPRQEVIKKLWEYIRAHGLQDPKDRRYILCDSSLKDLFQKDRVQCFSMNKLLTRHIGAKHEIVMESDNEDIVLSDPDSDEQHQAKRAKPPPKNKKTKSSRKSGTGGGFQMPSVLSADLQKVIPHQQVVKELWVYIKQHNLQDPADKRVILLDDALRQIFSTPESPMDKINCFSMQKHLSRHLSKPGADADGPPASEQKLDMAGGADSNSSLPSTTPADSQDNLHSHTIPG